MTIWFFMLAVSQDCLLTSYKQGKLRNRQTFSDKSPVQGDEEELQVMRFVNDVTRVLPEDKINI